MPQKPVFISSLWIELELKSAAGNEGKFLQKMTFA